MKIKIISYARLINTGDYENERIQIDAEVNEGETYEQVLAELKSLVDGSVQDNEPEGYPLYGMNANLINTFYTIEGWLDLFEDGIERTSDVRAYWGQNKDVFYAIKEEAQSDRSLSANIYIVEQAIAKALSPKGRR